MTSHITGNDGIELVHTENCINLLEGVFLVPTAYGIVLFDFPELSVL